MKAIRKIFLSTLFVTMLLFTNTSIASAKSYNDTISGLGDGYLNEYIKMDRGGQSHDYNMSMITRKSDNHFVYCIQPATPILSSVTYSGTDTDQEVVAHLSKSQWKRIELLAYYGYQYGNHTDKKWYAITQFLIWNTANDGWDIYFTDTRGGNRISKYKV